MIAAYLGKKIVAYSEEIPQKEKKLLQRSEERQTRPDDPLLQMAYRNLHKPETLTRERKTPKILSCPLCLGRMALHLKNNSRVSYSTEVIS